ncbi:hypothetical protein BGY98DRAFT_1165595 [Russula aff. rugulosa BPL654]|nr:hypothetical protein BGY98DRAFT_1165595 [Russula aff. rugulosa BPL654]
MQTLLPHDAQCLIPLIQPSYANDCSTFVLVFVGGWQAGDSPAVHRHHNPFTSHPVLLYSLLDLLSDAKEGKCLATSQSADDAVPVEASAEFMSENDPASSLIATSSRYAMTRTLGRTAELSIALMTGIQFNSRPSNVLAPTNQRSSIRLASRSYSSESVKSTVKQILS